MTDVDGVRGADGHRLDDDHAGRGRGADRRRHRSAAAWCPRSGRRSSALAWEGAEAIIADGSAPDALARALDDPTFGTRVSARTRPRRRGVSGQHAMMVKRDRHAAIRRARDRAPHRQPGRARRRALGPRLRGHPGHREPRHRGARPGQGHARRPVDLRRAGGHRRPAPAVRRTAPADPGRHPGHRRPERPDPRPDGPARHGQRHRPGDRRVHALASRSARSPATTRSSSCSPTSPRCWAGSSGSKPCNAAAEAAYAMEALSR